MNPEELTQRAMEKWREDVTKSPFDVYSGVVGDLTNPTKTVVKAYEPETPVEIMAAMRQFFRQAGEEPLKYDDAVAITRRKRGTLKNLACRLRTTSDPTLPEGTIRLRQIPGASWMLGGPASEEGPVNGNPGADFICPAPGSREQGFDAKKFAETLS